MKCSFEGCERDISGHMQAKGAHLYREGDEKKGFKYNYIAPTCTQCNSGSSGKSFDYDGPKTKWKPLREGIPVLRIRPYQASRKPEDLSPWALSDAEREDYPGHKPRSISPARKPSASSSDSD